VRALRKRSGWSQTQLGKQVETPQNVISRYEDPDYGKLSLTTLKRLASAFDVALVVKFAAFSELKRLAEDRSSEALAVASYEMEKAVTETSPIDGMTTSIDQRVTPGTTDAKVTPIEKYVKGPRLDARKLSNESTKGGYLYGNV
jgi:transcriptional regulator with XRE-family HTH domain